MFTTLKSFAADIEIQVLTGDESLLLCLSSADHMPKGLRLAMEEAGQEWLDRHAGALDLRRPEDIEQENRDDDQYHAATDAA